MFGSLIRVLYILNAKIQFAVAYSAVNSVKMSQSGSAFFTCASLHLLLIILSLAGCKVLISASPRMQWYCRLVMKNSVLDS